MANHFLSNHFASQHFFSNHFRGGQVLAEPPEPGPLAKTKPSTLLVQVKAASVCKVGDTAWAVKIAAASSDLSSLESSIARLMSKLKLLEATDPLLVQINAVLSCKIEETDFDDLVASADVGLDSLSNSLSSLKSNTRTLEAALRTHLRRQRNNL